MSVLRKALLPVMLCGSIAGGALSGCAIAPHSASVGDSSAGNTTTANATTTAVTSLATIENAGLDIALEQGPATSTFVIATSGALPAHDVVTLAEPSRVRVQFEGLASANSLSQNLLNNDFVKDVTVSPNENGATVDFTLTRVGQDPLLTKQSVSSNENELRIVFQDASLRSAPSMDSDDYAAPNLDGAATTETGVADTTSNVPGATEITTTTSSNTAAINSGVTVSELSFSKKPGTAGSVTISVSGTTPFEMSQTAASEFVLNIPGATIERVAALPKIAPAGFPGIRSVRGVQGVEGVQVRMFVDQGVSLTANASGSEIVVRTENAAANAGARGQLATETEEAAPEAAAPTAEGTDGGAEIFSADGSKQYTGRLISLDLQDTDIDNALRIIAEVSNLNIIASDDVTGKVTLRLIDVPWDQALDVILKTNGLDQVQEGNVVRIAPVEKLRAEREALKDAKRAAEELEDLQVRYIRVSYARVDELREQVEAVLTERGTVSTDERTNQLIVKDISKGQKDVLELIKRLDLRTPQVLLETQIVEAQRNILRDLGFQWNYRYTASAATGNATGYNFPDSVAIGGGTADGAGNAQMVNFPAAITDAAGTAITAVLDSADGSRALDARLSALETEGRVKVISRPQVATINSRQAEIKSVESVRVRLPDSGLSVATGAGANAAGGGNTAFEEIEVGIELRVTPQASPDYFVLLDIYARSSTFGSTVVDNIPSTLEREATSTILVKSGQTFALGGVYRIEDSDSVEGVPFFKDIPVLGHLFRRTLVNKGDEELIFFITPHIVEGSFDPSLM